MNDPELDGPILEHSHDILTSLRGRISRQSESGQAQGSHKHKKTAGEEIQQEILQDEEEEEEVTGYFKPKRYWISSVALPLVAGWYTRTFGPFASLFSICAIVEGWRVSVPEGGYEAQGVPVKDPKWLIAVNVVSLVLALAANLALLFNFAHRIKYTIAQPFVIILWYISAILLVVPLGITPYIPLPPRLDSSPSSPHHYFSSSYYFAIISAVLYTFVSTILAINYIMAMKPYLLRPFRRNSESKREPDRPPPSFSPLTLPQRTLMLQSISYVLYLGIGALIFSHIEGWPYTDAVYWADYTLLTVGLGTDFPLETVLGRGLLPLYALGGIVTLGLVISSVRGLVIERGKEEVGKRGLGKAVQKLQRDMNSSNGNSSHGLQEIDAHRDAFERMRLAQAKAEKKESIWKAINSLIAFLLVWFGGALGFYFTEKHQRWTYPTSLYFTYTSIFTIGYGDYYPQSNAGKPFFVVWSILAVPTVTVVISSIGGLLVGGVKIMTMKIANWTILPEKKAESSEAEAEKALGAVEGEVKSKGVEKRKDEELDVLELRLVREITKLVSHLRETGGKGRQHDWEEWKAWIRLLEEHAEGYNHTREGSEEGEGDGDSVRRLLGKPDWWFEKRGPLFTDTSETEWVLVRLCERLEAVLAVKAHREGQIVHGSEEGSGDR